ncbi:sialidase family protein [Galbibacter pacificus]|uniref:exo-alpha-sialidase n=1 Tax=Galbibacter pacificus TaxID=2996052 RepID=A0ABT6FNF0_9FLAO|nr:sialidase family protein [Galbibacter pacificus]MDG3581111.1 exo-alpha-sialidase [Galbibacter pacificus]MDG3584589.1 exo-alpha-sialidase [Galbibacter pacificus]
MCQDNIILKRFLCATIFIAMIVSCTEKPENIIVEQQQKIYPVLKNKEVNQLLLIDVILKDTLKPAVLKGMSINLKGTDVNDLSSASIFHIKEKHKIGEDPMLFSTLKKLSEEITFKGNFKLNKEHNYFLLSCTLKENVDITHKVMAYCESVATMDGFVAARPLKAPKKLRMGVAVRKHGDDNVHTYRIPGMVTTNDGILLASYDVRRDMSRDLQGDIDIGISRSLDGGNTWEPMIIAMDKGEYGGLPEKFNGISDASLLVDKKTNTVYLAGLWMHGVINKEGKWIEGLTDENDEWNHQWKNKGSQPGFGIKETSQFLISKSNDNGKTWGQPINITKMCKKKGWWLFAPAPGRGITMHDGTLVFPTQGRDEQGVSFSNITYSTDNGKTWKTSNPAHNNTTECAVVELSPGVLMLNMRDNRNRKDKSKTNGRAVYITNDMGKTWKEHSSSHKALPEPVCMASLYQFNINKDNCNNSVLLFSNPNTKEGRNNITLKASVDNGKTWPEEKQVLLDEGYGRGYSCITHVGKDHVGVLYESSQADMTFQKIPLKDLMINDTN